MVPGLGHNLRQLVGGKRRSATNGVGEHTERRPTNQSQGWFSARFGARRRYPSRWALRVALAEFEDEMRKQDVGLTTELEYWGLRRRHHVGDDGRAGAICHDQAERNTGEARHGASKRQMHSLLHYACKN